MKYLNLSIIAFALITFLFSSCSKDDDDKTSPIISGLEIGLGNNKELHQGGELHLEFEVSDNEGLAYYTIEIHPEMKSGNMQWEYENRWDFEGSPKNDQVHHHEIMVAEDADLGTYHFHLKIADVNGNITSVEEYVELNEAIAGNGPEIHIEDHPTEGQVFTDGQSITIAGHAHSETSHIAGMFIAIVKESDNLPNEEVNASNAIVIFHEHDFELYEVDFNESITVGATEDNNHPAPGAIASWALGESYILLKAVDEEGHVSFSQHFHIEVNGAKF
jgi:hypothetical protein